MLNVYDDTYEAYEYNCSSCDQKEHVLKEAASELKLVMDSVMTLTKIHSEVEKKLLDNLENACHMLGIKFMGNV